MNDRAIVYRRKYNIPSEWGTAVNVQAMVYGNTGDQSGSGVAFTRDPATGEKVFYGEFLINAQGEDVVAGVRTPEPVARAEGTICRTRTRNWNPSAARSKGISAMCRTLSSPSRTARCSCSKPATANAPASPPCDSPWKWRKRGLIDWKTAIQPRPGRPARPVARAGVRAQGVESRAVHRPRPARRPRRRQRPVVSQRRTRGGTRREGRKSPARPQRNFTRGPARHDRRRRHSHRQGRRQFARRARRPADGQSLRLRRGRVAD